MQVKRALILFQWFFVRFVVKVAFFEEMLYKKRVNVGPKFECENGLGLSETGRVIIITQKLSSGFKENSHFTFSCSSSLTSH
jgi:hypothetical protein